MRGEKTFAGFVFVAYYLIWKTGAFQETAKNKNKRSYEF